MKSAARAQGGCAAAANGSQIPLPRRKGVNKGDNALDLDDAESDASKDEFVAKAKMSLLGNASFCCTSGQKEDYAPEPKFAPRSPRKKHPAATVVAKREIVAPSAEICTPSSPLVAAKRGFLARNKQRKSDRVVLTDYQVKDPLQCGNGPSHVRKDDPSDRPHVQNGDSRLRPPDDRKKGLVTPQQHKRPLRDPRPEQAEVRQQKYTEVMRKLRKDVPHYAPSNITSLNVESNKLFKRNNKVVDSCQLSRSDQNGLMDDVCSTNDDAKCIANGSCDNSSTNRISKRNVTDIGSASEDKASNVLDPPPTKDTRLCVKVVEKLDTPTKKVANAAVQENEDFDCPCCEKEKSEDDIDASKVDIDNSREVENRLQLELNSLRTELEVERAKLESKNGHVIRLEREVSAMDQLKRELLKEQELRNIAEEKLEKMLEILRIKETEKRTESKATQKNDELRCNTSFFAEASSPLLFGNESRVRRYQSYIAKLEKDNQMLINELKKFKDLSPRSQEEQAKELLEKLGKLEQENRQQQMQYETCLDEVANKLVHTVLVQKRLEEECKVLHLRVEQLEQENENLKELIKDEDNENAEQKKSSETPTQETKEVKVQISHAQQSPSLPSKSESLVPQRPSNLSEKKTIKGKPKYSLDCSNPIDDLKTPVASPLSPGSKTPSASKIPSFGSSKPVQTGQVRKKTKTEEAIPTKGRAEAEPKSKQNPTSATASHVPKNPAILSPTSRSKFLASAADSAKNATSAKRKRTSRCASPVENKESKQRLRSNQVGWEGSDGASLINLCKTSVPISPSVHFPPTPTRINHQIWSFNCTLQEPRALESPRKVADSLANLAAMSETKSSVSSEDSSSADVVHKTRDEGYSTMSSDLQPDSATDVNVSEQDENSSTYLVTEKVLRCASDDSVTECLECSMSSSSDSGFGPLHQVAKFKASNRHSSDEDDDNGKFLKTNNSHATVKIRGPIASADAIENLISQCDVFSQQKSFKNYAETSQNDVFSDKLLTPTKDRILQDLFASRVQQERNNLTPVCHENVTNWRTEPESSSRNESRSIVETAEKATLTEPEEETWREKALAHFIDESIWSLYSSENEIEVKNFPFDPMQQCERSMEDLVDTSPCIIVTSETQKNADIGSDSLHQDQVPERQNCLERVASDTVLYLKDAIQELESSMMRGLKSSKNVAFRNVSGLQQDGVLAAEDAETSDWKPEIIKSLESAMLRQNNLAWPSPSRSSSVSSLQSSTSCHVVSDGTDDVDATRTSRKGSQDPELSASDVEYENLEHKDFVERWLRKEIAQEASPKATVAKQLEPVGELGEWNPSLFQRKTSLPSESPERIQLPSRVRLLSYPTCSTPIRNRTSPRDNSSSPIRSSPMFAREGTPDDEVIVQAVEDFESSVESETKEFNGDFYKLCSVGSIRSLDHVSSFKPKPAEATNLPKNFQESHCSDEAGSAGNRAQTETSADNRIAEPFPSSSKTKVISRASPERRQRPMTKAKQSATNHRPGPQGTKNQPKPNPARAEQQSQSTRGKVPSPKSSTANSSGQANAKPIRPVSLDLANAPRVPEHGSNECLADSPQATKEGHRNSSATTNASRVHGHIVAPDEVSRGLPSTPEQRRNANPESAVPAELRGDDSRPDPAGVPQRRDLLERQQKTSMGPFALPATPEVSVWSRRQQWKRERRLARQSRMKEGCGTSWIHLQDNPDLYDPKARASLMDSLRAPTSSSGSSSSEEEEGGPNKDNLSPHHKTPREKKLAVKRRPSIVDRLGLFYRFGEREQEAISYFDFLDDMPSSSLETLNRRMSAPHCEIPRRSPPPPSTEKELTRSLSPGNRPKKMADAARSTPKVARRLRLPNLWNQPLSHNMSSSTLNSQDCEILDHISLSDSCAESYSSTPDSYEEAS